MFTFNLATVLKVQQHKENIAHKDLLEAKLVLERLCDELKMLQEQLHVFDEEVVRSRSINQEIVGWQNQAQYRLSLLKKIHQQKVSIEEAKEVFEEKRQALLARMQSRKILENLEAKRYAEWEQEQQRLQALFFDDLTTLRHN